MIFNTGTVKKNLVNQNYKLGLVVAMVIIMFLSLTMMEVGAVTYGVKYTKHNLGLTNQDKGSGIQFRASNETQICVFCHTPHNANATGGKKFLWNRPEPVAASFTLYTASKTLNFSKGIQISEISKMCMSCHDGVTAVNALANGSTVAMSTATKLGEIYIPFGEDAAGIGANIGGGDPTVGPTTGGNLTNDHPISFIYDADLAIADGTLRTPDAGGASVTYPLGSTPLPLWNAGTGYKVECVTCHDPHINYNATYGGDPSLKPFLRKSNGSSNLCFTCHDK